MKKPEPIPHDNSPAPVQDARTMVAATPTPENTPIPGGGSWCWSDTAPHWVSNDTQPTAQTQE